VAGADGREPRGLKLVEELDLGKSSYAVRLRNDVGYAIYVRPRKWHGATTAWQRLCRSPMGKLHAELVKTLGPQIIAAIRKGV
jgi:hypothetical protein